MRRQILRAYVEVLGRSAELMELCSTTPGGREELARAIAEKFQLRPVAADAVLGLQVSRFTTDALATIRNELAETERALTQDRSH